MTDEAAMARCRELAEEARQSGDATVGCVIVREGALLAEACESVLRLHDPTAHAELLAVRLACASLQTTRLRGSVLYSNVEPCCMCAYAIREAGIERVVFQRLIGELGGTIPTQALLTLKTEEWGPAPVVQILNRF